MPLELGKLYTREEVQEAIGVSNPTHKGKWGTGYTQHEGEFYIFANVGAAGRTGHDYPNEWDGEMFHWAAKSTTTMSQGQMRDLMQPGRPCHIFTRHGNRDRFVYHGLAQPTNPREERPVMFTWVFDGGPGGPGIIVDPPPPPPLHTEYRTAKTTNEGHNSTIEQGTLNRNPALLERALKSHSATQNALAGKLGAMGIEPLSPMGRVDYDIAWYEPKGLALGEVKSITEANEVAQLRTGLGQIQDYAAELEHCGEKIGRLILVLEKEPMSPAHWKRACARAGIILTWAPDFKGV